MKTKKILAATLIACICGFTSCSNEEEVDNLRGEVKIITSVSGTTKAAIDPATGGGNLENGDKILLIVYKQSAGTGIGLEDYTIGSSKLHWDNLISGDYSGTQWSEDLPPALGEPPYDFIAYYPNVTLQQMILFNAATATNPDLLAAKIAGVAKGGTVYLAFNHLMHKLVVNLSSNDYTESELSSATVGLKNLYSTVSVNYIDVTIHYASASGTDAYPHKQGASTGFIVAPQNLAAAGTDLIEIALDGKTFTYKIPAGLTVLESGKVLTLNLELKKASGVVEGIVSDYNPGGGIITWN